MVSRRLAALLLAPLLCALIGCASANSHGRNSQFTNRDASSSQKRAAASRLLASAYEAESKGEIRKARQLYASILAQDPDHAIAIQRLATLSAEDGAEVIASEADESAGAVIKMTEHEKDEDGRANAHSGSAAPKKIKADSDAPAPVPVPVDTPKAAEPAVESSYDEPTLELKPNVRKRKSKTARNRSFAQTIETTVPTNESKPTSHSSSDVKVSRKKTPQESPAVLEAHRIPADQFVLPIIVKHDEAPPKPEAKPVQKIEEAPPDDLPLIVPRKPLPGPQTKVNRPKWDVEIVPSIDSMVGALNSDNATRRSRAISRLQHAGEQAGAALPALRLALDAESDPLMRRRLAETILTIAPEDDQAVAVLDENLGRKTNGTKLAAAAAAR